MPKMLRHKTTGEVFPMNAAMAQHDMMEIFDQPDPQFDKPVPPSEPPKKEKRPKTRVRKEAAPKKAPVAAKPEPVAVEPEPVPEPVMDDIDISDIELDDDDA